jgi:hypothetical protein
VIRQAISCDICGRDKQQTNHWFVAYEHGSELRISGWNSHARTSAKAKHLCGQTCLHKLVDDFMARTLASRAADLGEPIALPTAVMDDVQPIVRTDASLTSPPLRRLPVSAIAPVLLPHHDETEPAAPITAALRIDPVDEGNPPPNRPAFNARAWRAEAWRREQEREKRNTHNASPRHGSVA